MPLITNCFLKMAGFLDGIGKVLGDAGGVINEVVVKPVSDVVKALPEMAVSAVGGHCSFYNNTKYKVEIVYHDKTRTLNPGEIHRHFLFKGFSVDLVMKFTDTKEERINFPATKYENRTHEMGRIFEDKIKAYEMSLVNVISGFSKWHLILNHPGGYDEEVEIVIFTKNSWRKMQEEGGEKEAKVSGMIKAVELGLSAKAFIKVNQVDEFERQTTEKRKRKFKDPCYLWQEIVVIKTNQESPFHELLIPTAHIEQTSTHNEPGRNKFIYDRKGDG